VTASLQFSCSRSIAGLQQRETGFLLWYALKNSSAHLCRSHPRRGGFWGRRVKAHPVSEPGSARRLASLEVPIPSQNGEVLIRAQRESASGMPDVAIRRGTYSHMPPLPASPVRACRHHREGRRRRDVAPWRAARLNAPRANGHIAAAIIRYVATPADATFVLPDMSLATPPRRLAIIRSPITSSTTPCTRTKARPCCSMPPAGGKGNALIDLAKVAASP